MSEENKQNTVNHRNTNMEHSGLFLKFSNALLVSRISEAEFHVNPLPINLFPSTRNIEDIVIILFTFI